MCITTPLLLHYYVVQKPVILTYNASQHGLGATWLQDGELVAYASCTLTDTDTRYAWIKKELLAMVFRMLKVL